MTSKRIWLSFLVLLSSMGVAHAQERTITGKVEEANTREPIPGAMITAQGTDSAAISEGDGSFSLTGIPAGEVTLRVSAVGYGETTVTVGADQAQVQVALSLARSEEILIIGRAPQITRQNLANGASVVKGEDVNRVPSQTLESSLQGRISGANIQSNSGAPGGGLQISLRGVSTINGESSPLFVVDGVLISNEAIRSNVGAVTESGGGSNASVQDNPVNRVADLNPGDIESIEVLKGPAAAALYGSKATNGVVIITTKRGRAGEARVSVTQRFGTYQLANKLGARVFGSLEEAVAVHGEAARAYYQEGKVYDHEEELANNHGLASETSASMSGGTEDTGYFASFMTRHDPGIIDNTGYEKQSMRLNLSHDFDKRLKLATTLNVVHSDAQRSVTNNDNAGISHYMALVSTPSFIDLRAYDDGTFPANPFTGSFNNPLQTAAIMNDSEEVWRFIGSTSANLRVWEDRIQTINLGANLGVDRFQQKNTLLFPPELHFTPPDRAKGIALDASSEVLNLNVGINGVYSHTPLSNAFQAATTMGFQYDQRAVDSIYVVARNLTAGQPNVDSAPDRAASQERALIKDVGVHLQQEVRLLGDRLTLLGALLGERSSVNGDADKLYFYPKAATTYRLPVPETIFELARARVAYGETGNKADYAAKFTPLDTTQNVDGNGGLIGRGVYGDENIRPERQREIEVGVDAVGMDGRGVLEMTVYQRSIDDLIIQRNVAPSTGYEIERLNAGALRNRGIELMLQLTPVKRDDLSWLSRTIFSLNRSRITRLDVPDFNVGGFGTSLGVFRMEEGASATQIIGNYIMENGEIGQKKLGDAEPTFRMSFVNNVTYRDFELSSLLDWQQGSNIINLTRVLYDGAANSVDYVEAGAERITRLSNGETGVYVEDATFLKVREIALSYTLPKAMLAQAGFMERAKVSLSGRNLLTFTTYSGMDPEVSNFGNQTIARNIDVAPFPVSRSFWLSLEAGF